MVWLILLDRSAESGREKRLDVLLLEKGLAESRERAKALIMEGLVYVNNQKSDKPGENVALDAKLEVRGKGLAYVSRGGLSWKRPWNISHYTSGKDCHGYWCFYRGIH